MLSLGRTGERDMRCSATRVSVGIFVVAAVLSACGGGGAASPGTVVSEAFSDVVSGNLTGLCNYVLPSNQRSCRTAAASAGSGNTGSGSISVTNVETQGNEALVSITGRACVSGQCSSNEDASLGMPSSKVSFSTAFAAAITAGNSSSVSTFSPVPCMLVNGQWYLDTSGP